MQYSWTAGISWRYVRSPGRRYINKRRRAQKILLLRSPRLAEIRVAEVGEEVAAEEEKRGSRTSE